MAGRWGKKKDKVEGGAEAEVVKEQSEGEVVEAEEKKKEAVVEVEKEKEEEVVEEEEEHDLSDVAIALTRSEAVVSELSYHDEVMNPERYDALHMAGLAMEFLTVDEELLKLFYDYASSRDEAERKIIESQKEKESEEANRSPEIA